MFEKWDWTKYFINIRKHNDQSNNTCRKVCFDFFIIFTF